MLLTGCMVFEIEKTTLRGVLSREKAFSSEKTAFFFIWEEGKKLPKSGAFLTWQAGKRELEYYIILHLIMKRTFQAKQGIQTRGGDFGPKWERRIFWDIRSRKSAKIGAEEKIS